VPAKNECPKIESWQALFREPVQQDEWERYERHLESCTECQHRLDRTVELSGLVQRLGREVGDPTKVPDDPTLSRFLQQLHRSTPASEVETVDPPDLFFLRRDDRHELLGTLDQYEVQEVIGQGAFGVVLKAYEPALQRLVAIKVLSPALAGSATARKRFTREAQAAAAVCHDHIVAVHAVGETAGLPYLVMQYVGGESLQARLDRSGPLDLAEIVRIGMQTASGLAAAHAQGLIHRDIKPANLLLENGLARVKITDFGLARAVDDIGLTQDGVVAGTPEYMAPEQARGETVDPRCDLFSLGSVLYAMCTGVPPFRSSSTPAVLRQVSDHEPRAIRSLNSDVPEWLEALIARLMAKDPAQRFQSAAEVATLLEAYLAHVRQPINFLAPELPTGQPEAGSRTGVATRTSRPLLWLAPLTLGLVILVGLGLAMGFGDGGAADGNAHAEADKGRDLGEMPARFRQDFRAPDANHPLLRTIGEGVEWEPAGVRLRQPGNQGVLRATGIAPYFQIQGDFEITASYEILHVDRPTTGYGVGVSVYAALDPDTNDAVSLARRLMPDGRTLFMSDRMTPIADEPNRLRHQVKTFPSTALTGKLRLRREGSMLHFLVAEGDNPEFVEVDELEFSKEEVRFFQISGNAGNSTAGFDIRVLDLAVRADKLPGAPEIAADGSATAEQNPGGKRWLLAGAVVGLAITLTSVLGVWLRARRRQTAEVSRQTQEQETAPSVSFQCPGCHRKLKARAELVGKEVKCPQCCQVVCIPEGA
jgi:serine/threonine protein kinase